MVCVYFVMVFFFQAEDGIRDLVRSRGLGDVYKRQATHRVEHLLGALGQLIDTDRLDVGGLVEERRVERLSLIHI